MIEAYVCIEAPGDSFFKKKKKLLSNLTKSSTSDSIDILDKPLSARSL